MDHPIPHYLKRVGDIHRYVRKVTGLTGQPLHDLVEQTLRTRTVSVPSGAKPPPDYAVPPQMRGVSEIRAYLRAVHGLSGKELASAVAKARRKAMNQAPVQSDPLPHLPVVP